jgi:hypothetical protein
MKTTLLVLLLFISACHSNNDYLLIKTDKNNMPCYVSTTGDTVIRPGKYSMCFTDTFRNLAMVYKPDVGFVGINRDEKVLFNIFPFDNGPDYFSEGYFRIIKTGKIGYADKDGSIKIKPQFGCAYPFERGIAKVGLDCKTIPLGEHSVWESNAWFYINKAGKRVK